jgi:acyl dehydratase
MEAKDLSFEDLHVGDRASFSQIITSGDVEAFAKLSGDYNPLHMDEAYASTTSFEKRVVHGMCLGALFSRIVGMQLPGKRCVYLKQELSFRNPVFIGEDIQVEGVIISKSESTRTLTLSTKITKGEVICVEGEALVKII